MIRLPVLVAFLGSLSLVTLAACGPTTHPLELDGGQAGAGGAGGTGSPTVPGTVGTGGNAGDPGGAGGSGGGDRVDAGRRGDNNGGRRGDRDGGSATDPRDGGRFGGDPRDGGRSGGDPRDGGRTRPDAAPVPECPAGTMANGMCTAQGGLCAISGDAGIRALCSCGSGGRRRGDAGTSGTWRCFGR